MVLGGPAIGRCLGHEGRALVNAISALLKETPQSSLALLMEFSISVPLPFPCAETQDVSDCSCKGRKDPFSLFS